MRYGVIAEGRADVAVVRAVLKALKGIDGSEVVSIRPREQMDETDLDEMRFSDWLLVLKSCEDEDLLSAFFDAIEDDALLIVQIDTAEHTEAGYDVPSPLRERDLDWKAYSEELRQQVKLKIATLLPEAYRDKVAYAIAVEETDAWLLPLLDTSSKETAQYANPKERLQRLIGQLKPKEQRAYVDTSKKNLNYENVSKNLRKNIKQCRIRNKSLDLFCIEIEEHVNSVMP